VKFGLAALVGGLQSLDFCHECGGECGRGGDVPVYGFAEVAVVEGEEVGESEDVLQIDAGFGVVGERGLVDWLVDGLSSLLLFYT
jgi:hypothetical protein